MLFQRKVYFLNSMYVESIIKCLIRSISYSKKEQIMKTTSKILKRTKRIEPMIISYCIEFALTYFYV